MTHRVRHLAGLAVWTMVLSWPVLLHRYPRAGHDSSEHLRWLTQFSRQFLAGDLYPRWLVDLNFGLGSPAFFFYPPLPYWITSLFTPIAPAVYDVPLVLGIGATMALAASGGAAYLWLSSFVSPRSALVGAAAYQAMPYHLAIDLWTRGAYSEFWGFVWMPLVLYFVERLRRGRRGAFAGLAASYAGLAMTHLPTVLVFSALPVAVAALAPVNRVRAVARVSTALVLGAGVAAVFVLPALLGQSHVALGAAGDAATGSMASGHFDFRRGFFFPGWQSDAARDYLEWHVFLLVGSMLGLAACAAAWVAMARGLGSSRRLAAFWSACAVVCLLMMLPLSEPIYRAIPPLPLIQFPWRFNASLCVAVTALIGLAVDAAAGPPSRGQRWVGAAALMFTLAWLPQAVPALRSGFRSHATWATPEEAMADATGPDVAEYRPSGASVVPKVLAGRFGAGPMDAASSRVLITSGHGAADVRAWAPRRLRIATSGTDPMEVLVRQYFFTGWEATSRLRPDGAHAHATPDGLLAITVAPGEHDIDIVMTAWPSEQWGLRVSLGSVAVLAVVGLRSLIGRRPPADRVDPGDHDSGG